MRRLCRNTGGADILQVHRERYVSMAPRTVLGIMRLSGNIRSNGRVFQCGGDMFCNKVKVPVSLSIMLCISVSAFAADSAEDIKLRMGSGDPVAGKGKIGICKVCHGEDGNSTTVHFPKLTGQYGDYIVKQLNDFRSGARKDPMMSAMVQSAGSDQDLRDIAAYYASQQKMSGVRRVSNRAGEARFNEEGVGCVNCHGVNGKGIAPEHSQSPVIGGQHKEYLVRQLKSFRSGARSNDPGGIMAVGVSTMSDEDIENVASYVSGL